MSRSMKILLAVAVALAGLTLDSQHATHAVAAGGNSAEPAPPQVSPERVFTPSVVAQEECWPPGIPAGAIPGQPEVVVCQIDASGAGTAVATENGWRDDFDHGLSFADFTTTSYRLFYDPEIYAAIFWRHADHWMVDLVPDGPDDPPEKQRIGSVMLSPDQAFRFRDAKFIVEATYAAGHPDYGQHAWGEIIITTADQPVYEASEGGQRPRGGELYGIDMFPDAWTLGCRLHATGVTTCALMIDNDRSAVQGGRLWEISWHQVVGETVFGGYSDGSLLRFCAAGEPDTQCRDRFQLELTPTSLTIFVNGEKFFAQTGLPPLPFEFMNSDLYVYLASTASNSIDDAIRYHWDDVTVNTAEPLVNGPSLTERVNLPISWRQ